MLVFLKPAEWDEKQPGKSPAEERKEEIDLYG